MNSWRSDSCGRTGSLNNHSKIFGSDNLTLITAGGMGESVNSTPLALRYILIHGWTGISNLA